MIKRIGSASLVALSVGLLVACSDDPAEGARDTTSVAASPSVDSTPASTVAPSIAPMTTFPAPATEPPTSTPVDGVTIDEAAVWSLEPASRLTAESQSFIALVMRLGCHGGTTAPISGPEIELREEEVVVTFTAAPPVGHQTCPGNDLVPVAVDLGVPIGDRPLLDGACQPGGPALATSWCPADANRRTSTAFAWLEDGAAAVPPADRLAAYCESAAALAGERPESYVGSQQHRADIYRLVLLAPPELSGPLTTYVTFLTSGAITAADPDSNLTENWPDDVRAAIDAITTFEATTC